MQKSRKAYDLREVKLKEFYESKIESDKNILENFGETKEKIVNNGMYNNI